MANPYLYCTMMIIVSYKKITSNCAGWKIVIDCSIAT
jgi:hypothetical protein